MANLQWKFSWQSIVRFVNNQITNYQIRSPGTDNQLFECWVDDQPEICLAAWSGHWSEQKLALTGDKEYLVFFANIIWGAFRSLQTIWGTLWYHVRSLHTDTCRHTGTHCVENSERLSTWLHWILVGARVHSWGVVKASCLQTLVVINHSKCNHDDYCDDDLWKSPWNSIHLMLGFFRGAQPFQRARWTERCGHLGVFAHYWVDQPMQLRWPKRSRTYSVKVRDTVSNKIYVLNLSCQQLKVLF